MPNTLTPANHRRTTVFLGSFAVAFALAELMVLVKTSSLWDAISYLRDPQLPGPCSGLTLHDPVFYTRLWLTTVIVQSALVGAICAWSILPITALWRTANPAGRVTRILSAFAKFVIYGCLLYFFSPKPGDETVGCLQTKLRIDGPAGVFYVSIAFVMIALWAVTQRLETIPAETSEVQSLRQYITLRSMMQALVAFGSIVLVCGVIQVGLRQRLILAVGGNGAASRADVLLEGLRYTLLLAAAYVPIHIRFNIVGGLLLQTIINEPSSLAAEDVRQWADDKKAVEELLSLNSFEWKAFGPGLAIIAPAVAGFASKIIEGFISGH